MKGKAKRAKILLPKRIISTRNRPIFSSTLQEGPVIPPNEIRLVFESELSTIRENSGNVSEREIPTVDDVESCEESDGLVEVETTKRGEDPELRNCKLVQEHKSGCNICSNSKADGSNLSPDGKDRGMEEQEPFCSSFNEDISRVPQKMQFQSENSFSIIAGPSNKQHHIRPSTSLNTERNLLSTLQDGDETNNLFGWGPPAEELIKMDDSASQHEFRYYNGIRQRYCSSFKGNGFNVPDIIGFSCEETESTILNPRDHQETNDSSESDEHTLQNESEALEESVVLSADDSSVVSPPLKLRKTDKEPFCSTFRASITTEPSHMSFNQDKRGPTLRPRKIHFSIAEETEGDSMMKSNWDEEDSDYSARECESRDEEAELGIQKCVWMETHRLCCVHCNPVNTGKADLWDYQKRTSQGKAEHICPTCKKNFGRKGHLNTHILTVHEKKKPHACRKCEKSFGEKGNLNTHILTVHEKKKPHACNKCEQSFGHKNNLTAHLRIHDGEKPFTCPECNKSFTQKGDLTKHLRIHNKEQPFQCTTCNRKFNQSSHLKRHEKTQHPENIRGTDSE